MSGEFQVSAALHPGREPSYPLNSRLYVPQSRFGRFGEERNLFLSLRMELRFLCLPDRNLITMPKLSPKIASMWLESVQSCHMLS